MGDNDLDSLLARLAATPRREVPPRIGDGTERYEFRRHLGRGGFGDVYEARDREHGTVVALKRLKRSDPAWLYRFKREFRAVADLSHPNVIRLYELFCERKQWYLTMELIDGRRLSEHVSRAPEDLRSCFGQLALGISALHRSGCLHRDITPSNVLVERTGRVVLLDFGLARPQRRPQRDAPRTAVAGTPPYMAPELGMGDEPTEASDWYAFGVMLFEALAGRLPFEGTESAIFHGKLQGPPRAGIHRPGNDPALEDLALALLSPSSAGRPSADDVLSQLAVPGRMRRVRSARDAGELPVVGRQRQLEELATALERSHRGATLVTMHGSPGMGKSSLARGFAQGAADEGARFFAGRCHETESLPFKGLDGVIDMLCDDLLARPEAEVAALAPAGMTALAQMFPVLKRVETPSSRSAVHETPVLTPHGARSAARGALRELLSRMAQRDPIILFIDDLQWANDDSIQMLLHLLAPPAPPVLTIVAYRRDAVGIGGMLDQFLLEVANRPDIARVDLPIEPLDRDGVEQLLAEQPGRGIDVERALRDTGGHPYLLSRLLGAGAWVADGVPDLMAVLGSQIESLSRPARQLLEVVSLAASPLSHRAAFAVLGHVWNPLVVDELRRERLVQCTAPSSDGVIEPYHARVRESALDAMPAQRRRELHLMIAAFLETRGRGGPEALVHHYRHAGQHALALKWTRSAARQANDAFAFARAAELFRDALELADDDGERIELLVELAEARVQAGHRADAGRAYLEAAARADGLGDGEQAEMLRTIAGQHFLAAGQLERGIRLLRDALAAVGVALPADAATSVAATISAGAELATRGLMFVRRDEDEIPPRDLRRVDLELAVGRALSLSDVRASWVTARALLDALDAGEPERVQRAVASFAFSNSARAPDHPLVVECVALARSLAEELDDDLGRAWASLAAGMWRAQRAQFPAAIDDFRDAQWRFLAHGHVHAREVAMAQVAGLVLLGNYGVDLPSAQRRYARCLDDAIERDDLFAANWSRVIFAWIALAGGEIDVARDNLELARRSWPAANEELFAATALVSEIAVALYDAPATSWEVVERVRPQFERLYSSLIPATRCLFHRLSASSATAAYVAGHADRAQTAARIAVSAEITAEWEYGVAMAQAVEALLRAVQGDHAGYAALLAEAATGWQAQAQRGPRLAAQLRLHQLRDDVALADATADEMRAFGIAEPDRYALLFVGPRVAGSRARPRIEPAGTTGFSV